MSFTSLLSVFSLIFIPAIVFAQSVKLTDFHSIVFQQTHTFSGEVVAREHTTLSSQLAAQVTEVSKLLGQTVNQGDTLLRLDCRDYQSKLSINASSQKELIANLQLAELQVKRLKNLEQRQLASTNLLDETLARKQALLAQQASLKEQQKIIQRELARCEITAPYDAVVTEKMVGLGQFVNPGSPVFSLVSTDSLRIEVKLPLDLVEQLSLSQATASNLQGKTAKISAPEYSNILDAQSRLQTLWFKTKAGFLIGEQVAVQFKDTHSSFPASVVVRRNGQLGVFVAEAGKARFIELPKGQMGRAAMVPNDFPKHLSIISDGQQSLNNGDKLDD